MKPYNTIIKKMAMVAVIVLMTAVATQATEPKKFMDFTEDTSPLSTDSILKSAGGAGSKRSTLGNIVQKAHGLSDGMVMVSGGQMITDAMEDIIVAYAEDAAPSSDDVIAVVNDPGGSPGMKKVTLSNLIAALMSMVGSDVIKSAMIDWANIGNLGEDGLSIDYSLAADAANNNFDVYTVNRFFGVDTDIYLNLGTDGLFQAIADTRIDLQAPTFRHLYDASNYFQGTVSSAGAVAFTVAGSGPSVTFGAGTYNWIVNALNWSVDSSGNAWFAGTVQSAAVPSPWYYFLDSNNPGSDKQIARIGAEYISGPEGSENGDILLQSKEAGTFTTRLRFDQANGRWDIGAHGLKTTGYISSYFTDIPPQALSVTTEANITVGSEITSSVIDMTGDNDSDNDTLDLQDGTAAMDGRILTFTAIAGCDADDNIIIDVETDSTCTGCPNAGIFTLDSVGDSFTIRWNNTAGSWFYVGSYDAS